MSCSILVVGAGIAGLAVARALAMRGLECTVVDRRANLPGPGLGLNLPGNAVRALVALGAHDQVLPHGIPVLRREYRNGHGRLLFDVDDVEFWRGVGVPLCVRHGHLLRSLGSVGARVQFGRQVNAVRSAPGHVDVQCEGEASSRRFDFVVGADGVHSAVRGTVSDLAPVGSAMTRSGWRFVVDNPGVDCWTAWSGARGTFLLIPVEEGRVYGYAASTRGGATGADDRWLVRTFADFPDPVSRAVDSVRSGHGELHHSPVEETRLPRWHHGRLVLIGDAAHATGPVWAQGAALAMEDALVLADLLASGSDWSSVGPEFERRRRPRVEHVQAATDRMSRLARMPTWLRDRMAPTLGPSAYRKAYGPLLADL